MRTETQQQLESMLDEYRRARSRAQRLGAEMAALTATARSADGSVTATVGPQGDLRDLRIDADVARRLDLKTLTSRVLEASALAADQARAEVSRTVAGAMPPHLRQLMDPGGGADLGALLPEDIRALLRRHQERP
jgi:DNA-binding protein YbaB